MWNSLPENLKTNNKYSLFKTHVIKYIRENIEVHGNIIDHVYIILITI